MLEKEKVMSEFMDTSDDNLPNEEGVESVESTVDEAPDTDSVFAELETFEGDIGLEQLRKLADASGEHYTDEQLEQMWQDAQQAAARPVRQYKFYRDDAEVDSLDGLSAEELLSMQIAYKAMGAEQKKSLDELIRVAQFGHFNESRLAQVQGDRNSLQEKYTEAQQRLTQSEQDKQLWEYALSQYVQGNASPLEKLIELFKNAQSAPPVPTDMPAPDSEYQQQMAAQQVYYEIVVPSAYRLSQQYGANAQEIANVILHLTEQEAEFMSPERLEQIITVELPHMLEQAGYSPSDTQQAPVVNKDPKDAEIDRLKKELAGTKAGQKNAAVSAAKNRKSPPASNGSVPSAGETMPDIKTRQEMKEYLRS